MAKTVLITGASSGFGRDAALLFKEKGWNVSATMRAPEKAESWTKPAGLFTPKLDVTDRASMKSAIDQTIHKFGQIDVLVNNAGFALMGPLEGASEDNIKQQFDTNVLGVIGMIQIVLPLMREASGGVIVNLSSMGGLLSFPLLATYHSTKFAIEGLTEALQYEVAQHGVRLKLVEPGGAKTSFSGSSMIKTPHPAYQDLTSGFERAARSMEARLPGPEKVAKMIYRAATDGSSRLRYPVIAFPMITIRKLLGARLWTAMMSLWVRSILKKRSAQETGSAPKKKWLALKILTFVISALLIFLGFVKFKYGIGKEYPDLGANLATEPFVLEKLIPLDYPPGNLAVANNGHVYFNYHPLAKAERFSPATVFQWSNGKMEPFPSLEAQKDFQGTFGMTIDNQNRIWFIEPAALDFKHTRLSAFDLNTKKRVEYFEFPEGQAQFAEEIRITADGKHIILANPGLFRFTTPSVVVYSVLDHTFHSIKSDHPCLSPEDWIMQTPYGPNRLVWGLFNFAVGIDGIEISEDQKWLYIASMTHSRLCRAPMSVVLNSSTSSEAFDLSVEDLGQKPMSDGIAIDKNGRVILTDVEHGGIMAFNPTTKRLSALGRSKNIVWPDGVVVGADNSVYFTDSSIPSYIDQFVRPPKDSKLQEHRPYFIYRLKPH
jgi:NADP-dependent 3-hydroxy acid dehydrogenase YdfG